MPLTSSKMVFDEFKAGELHSGKDGPVLEAPSLAIATPLAAERRTKARKRHKRGTGR